MLIARRKRWKHRMRAKPRRHRYWKRTFRHLAKCASTQTPIVQAHYAVDRINIICSKSSQHFYAATTIKASIVLCNFVQVCGAREHKLEDPDTAPYLKSAIGLAGSRGDFGTLIERSYALCKEPISIKPVYHFASTPTSRVTNLRIYGDD